MSFHETYKEKVCKRCHESKNISDFVVPYGDGVASRPYCSECRRLIVLEKNAYQAALVKKRQAEKRKERALMLKSGEAFICPRCKRNFLIKYKTKNGICTGCAKQIIGNEEYNKMIDSAEERRKIIRKKWATSQHEKAEAENKEQDMIAAFLKKKKD